MTSSIHTGVVAVMMSCVLCGCGGGGPGVGPEALVQGDAGRDGSRPGPAADTPVTLGSAIGVVGCSNTNQATQGYLEQSAKDLLINTAQGGQAMTEWAVGAGGPWDRYERQRPTQGFSAVWLNLCQRAGDGLSQGLVDTVIANIRRRDPGAPIVISPLNFYETEDCPATNGNEVPNAGKGIADHTAAADPTIFRGPDLGPLPPSHLSTDRCHLNDTGRRLVGQQMVAYFD